MCVYCSGGLSPLKVQQLWKELISGSAQVRTSRADQDSGPNDVESAEVTGRQSSDQLTSSHGAERYDLSDHAEK